MTNEEKTIFNQMGGILWDANLEPSDFGRAFPHIGLDADQKQVVHDAWQTIELAYIDSLADMAGSSV